MKNQLIPITVCNETPGEYEPTLVGHGFQYRQLVAVDEKKNSFCTKHDHQGFSFRRDLDGMVHRCGGMPVIEIDDGGLFAVKNAGAALAPGWMQAQAQTVA